MSVFTQLTNHPNIKRLAILSQRIQHTRSSKVAGVLRIFLGIMFVMTGLMKLFIPFLGEAFSGQLIAANIPFYSFNLWVIPRLEVIIGLLLILGLFSRISSLIVINVMIVATYVHLAVDNPSLFPLQPEEPFIPLIVIIAAVYILWYGGGTWSIDLKSRK